MRPCFTLIAAAAAGQPAILSIFEDIGFWGTQAKDFVTQINAVEAKSIRVEINSPGGDVFAALTMYNSLRGSGKEIITKVMGVAASAASIVMLAGEKRIMPKNTHVMVHNPMTVVAGNAADMDEGAAFLRKIGTSLHATYVSRTGMKDEDVTTMLSKDTWMTADEALANGFATEVIDGIKAKASFDMARADLPEHVRKVYMSATKTPEEIAAEVEAAATASRLAAEAEAARVAAEAAATALKAVDNPEIATAIHTLVTTAGLEKHAMAFAIGCSTVAAAEARIVVAKTIKSLCTVAKLEASADAYIAANKTVAEVRADLATVLAEADQHIDTTQKKPAPNTGTSGVSSQSIWESRNKQTQLKRKA